MSSSGTPMPGLEKQRLLERVAQDGHELDYAAAELKADKEIKAVLVPPAGGPGGGPGGLGGAGGPRKRELTASAPR